MHRKRNIILFENVPAYNRTILYVPKASKRETLKIIKSESQIWDEKSTFVERQTKRERENTTTFNS